MALSSSENLSLALFLGPTQVFGICLINLLVSGLIIYSLQAGLNQLQNLDIWLSQMHSRPIFFTQAAVSKENTWMSNFPGEHRDLYR